MHHPAALRRMFTRTLRAAYCVCTQVTHLKPLIAEPQDVLARPGSTADQMFFVMQVQLFAIDATHPWRDADGFTLRAQGVVDGFIPRPHMAGQADASTSHATAPDVVDLNSMRGELPTHSRHHEKRFMEVVAVYTVGDHCGETDIITNTTRSVGLRALTMCRLQTLAKVRRSTPVH